MGWGDAFSEGFEQGRQRSRQTRLDLLNEEMLRGRMALQQAAAARADAALRERSTNAAALRDRMGYLDRMKVLGRETDPLKSLGVKYPGAGASEYVSRAMTLDDQIARDPASADVRPPLVRPDGSMAGPFPEGGVPSPREERSTNIATANRAFGAEQSRLQRALEAFRLRTTRAAHPGANRPPKVTALDIQLRSAYAKEKMADSLESGVIWDDKGLMRGLMTPEQIPQAKQRAAELRAQAAKEKALAAAGYRAAGVPAPNLAEIEGAGAAAFPPNLGVAPVPPPSMPGGPHETPEAAAARLQAQGLDADGIAAQLESMFSPEELAAFGQTQE